MGPSHADGAANDDNDDDVSEAETETGENQLLSYYKQIVHEVEADRDLYLKKLQQVEVTAQEAHRNRWKAIEHVRACVHACSFRPCVCACVRACVHASCVLVRVVTWGC